MLLTQSFGLEKIDRGYKPFIKSIGKYDAIKFFLAKDSRACFYQPKKFLTGEQHYD